MMNNRRHRYDERLREALLCETRKKPKKITNPLMVVWLFCQSLAVGHLLREREKQVQVASFNFKMFFF